MKTKKLIVFIFLSLLFYKVTGQNTLPDYSMKYRYTTAGGEVKDTTCSRFEISAWGQSGKFPSYLKWKNQPFSIQLSQIHGVGLFTDSATSFQAGQNIGMVFYKQASTGKFGLDYVESNIGMFINDSNTPNAVVVMTPSGLALKALSHIGPNTEITASYQALLQLFPNDLSAKRKIKYW